MRLGLATTLLPPDRENCSGFLEKMLSGESMGGMNGLPLPIPWKTGLSQNRVLVLMSHPRLIHPSSTLAIFGPRAANNSAAAR